MALPAATTWEVRTLGSSTNGGGFVTGATGTDYSQQNAAQYSFTDLASLTGTTNPSTISSVNHTFVANDVGNLIHVNSGTSWTAGFYQIVSVSAGIATLDRAVGTSATLTSGTYSVGGALNTPQSAFTPMTSSNTVWVKNDATYSIATGTNIAGITGSSAAPIQVLGYTTTRGDNVRATLQATASSVTILTLGNGVASTIINNFVLDCNTQTSSAGFSAPNSNNNYMMANVLCKNFTSLGIRTAAACTLRNVTCTGGTSAATAAFIDGANTGTVRKYLFCVAVSNVCTGFSLAAGGSGFILQWCISGNNSGSSSDGYILSTDGTDSLNSCIAYGNGRDGLRLTNTNELFNSSFYNNIFANNAGYGINSSGVNITNVNAYVADYNAFYNNTLGNYNQIPAGTHDVILSGDPFVNGAANNFGISGTGASAGLVAAGFPGLYFDIPTQGYLDIGAAQHQSTGGTTNIVVSKTINNFIGSEADYGA